MKLVFFKIENYTGYVIILMKRVLWLYCVVSRSVVSNSLRLPARAFPGAVLPPRGRWMCCAGFPWAFGLPSTAAEQGNQSMISELRAVTLVPGLEPNARNAGERGWLPAGACKPVLGRTE